MKWETGYWIGQPRIQPMATLSNSEITETLRLPAKETNGAGLHARGIWPGLLLASAVAGAAYMFRQLPGMTTFSPMILAIVIGIAFHNLVGTPAWGQPGV